MRVRNYIKTQPLIFDGAMGTYYAELDSAGKKCELSNLNNRELILEIHEKYLDAGCKAIKTNTFGANKIYLESDFEKVKEVITKGYNIAVEAISEKDAFVFCDIGPISFVKNENLFEDYKDIVDVFLSLGGGNFLFETFSSDEYLKDLAKYIKSKNKEAFILVEFAVSPDGFTRLGLSGKKIFKELSNVEEIDAIGFNCVSGPQHLLDYIKNFDIEDKIVSIMPNAGYPTVVNNRTFFDNSSDYFANQMLKIATQGVAILGGCCGTTPEYIRKTVQKLKTFTLDDILKAEVILKSESNESKIENEFLIKINSGEKVIAVELDPPMNTDIDFFMKGAKILKSLGVDAITIADCPIARARVDSSLLACKLKRELNITSIPHMTCRDRNINATKALLLGLNIEGVNNVLVVTGDPVPSAKKDEIKTMFSFNSAVLAKHITTLNEEIFKNPFNICAALNVNAINFESELNQARKKIISGVSMFLTQPILTKEALKNLKLAKETLDAKILGGIIPVVSYRNACFMNNEISGIKVSEEITELYKEVSKEEATELAVKISVRITKEIAPYVDGYYIITPFKRIDIVERIIVEINKTKGYASNRK
ncbi:bifunctional homocysteine S-methyltransferase/methylenetetrahydrofolate reductase [Clostridium vincentii]|uniref:Bifunctional homocysteine S-methyltransferase/5,10-methylenetetrahydrofolate reductase n=1 Tax=Clostridium vincentii TaxID=52704 RepID=A0A2T0BE20_9CLOT|nr:bifunctional homocysteine S-methyltransferase/methylenetetrahydrofolate reductase [Clostridium vincentii]PRR82141.1 Bifunctional homocysteine S-methyltransferase/5,10-methylenetetrahydrofolate reductase [Clostridium vincentii]